MEERVLIVEGRLEGVQSSRTTEGGPKDSEGLEWGWEGLESFRYGWECLRVDRNGLGGTLWPL